MRGISGANIVIAMGKSRNQLRLTRIGIVPGGFGGDVADDAVDAADLVGDAGGGVPREFARNGK